MVVLNGIEYECPSKIGMEILDDKWKFLILWSLSRKAMRMNELAESIPEVSTRTLSRKLKELEEAVIVIREVYAEVPPRVEYALSEHGKDLLEVVDVLERWGEKYAKAMQESNSV